MATRSKTLSKVESGEVRGAVFGFDVQSPFTFKTLRAASGLQPLEIVAQSLNAIHAEHELVADIVQPGFRARIYHDGLTYRLWVERVGWFDIDPRIPRIAAPVDLHPGVREELLWGVPALLCFLHRGDVSLHAAAIEIGGEAIVVVGPQAQGKSTLAAGFAQRGYRILSEDLTCIRVEPHPVVIPGPATVRLRNDVAGDLRAVGRSLDGRSDRTRYALFGGSDDDCQPVPIRAVLSLRRSASELRLEAVDPMRTLPDLWQTSFRVTRDHDRHCFESIAGLASVVPVFNLHRPLRIDALGMTVDHIVSELFPETQRGRAGHPRGSVCPQRDSNPRDHLERVAT
jgi:hypothetical protein